MTVHSPAALGRRRARRWACLCTGLLVTCLALALVYGAAERMFVHTTGIILIADLAPLLIVLGLTPPATDRSITTRRPDLRGVAHPLIALPLWAVGLGVWQLPALYEAALHDAGVQALQCAMLFACGLNLWMCLLGCLPAPTWFGERARVAGALTSRLLAAILANVLLWSDAVFYPYYAHGDAVHGLSPLADQNIAGAIVLAQEALMTLGLLCWLLVRASPRKRTATPRTAIQRTAIQAQRMRVRGAEPATGAYGRSEALL